MTSLAGSAAQELGGGVRPCFPSRDPAHNVTVPRPSAVLNFGICSFQCYNDKGDILLKWMKGDLSVKDNDHYLNRVGSLAGTSASRKIHPAVAVRT
jgi:hypothetical protein